MLYERELHCFLQEVRSDGRIGPSHISLFVAILQYAEERGMHNPICVFSKDLMPSAKISTMGTYNKNMWELHEYGYIRYIPSNNHFLGSLILITQKKNSDKKRLRLVNLDNKGGMR